MDDLNIMKSMSTRSLHSVRAGKNGLRAPSAEKPLEFDQFIELASQKFNCPCKFVVKKHAQSDSCTKSFKSNAQLKPKKPLTPQRQNAQEPVTPVTPVTPETPDTAVNEITEIETVNITAFYDTMKRLAEIVLQKENVPTILIQFFGIILPLQPLFTRLTFKRCQLSGYCVYEISKFLPMTSITEICLDDTQIPEANYALLLQKPSSLASLSLCRCNITDEVCQQIASTLKIAQTAEVKMTSLNLSSNRITDIGAKYFGEALRTNRHLRHLNLADNRITDEGADHIFQALKDFPLTYDEIINKWRRRFEFLKARHSLYKKFYRHESKSMEDLNSDNKKEKKINAVHMFMKSKASREDKGNESARADDSYHYKSELMAANELMDPFIDPFDQDYVKTVDGYSWCVGNMVLCFLNLSYNNISYECLKKLLVVLEHQSTHKKPQETGLLRVVVDGNLLPGSCAEMENIQEILKRNVISWTPRFSSMLKKRRSSSRTHNK